MTQTSRSVFLAALLAALSGCAAGPNYVKPSIDAPAAFKEAGQLPADGHWTWARPRDLAPRGKWWEAYNDLTLDALAEKVAVSNQTVRQYEALYREAQAAAQSAQAGFFPSVSAEASGSRANAGKGVTESRAVGLSASWEPDLWGRVSRAAEAGRAGAQASAADLAGATLSAQATLVQDYLALRVDDELKRMYDGTIAAYEKSLRLTQNQFAAGLVTRADVAQAETQLASARAQATDLGVQRAQLEHAIAVLTGEAPANFSLPPARLKARLPAVPALMPAQLLERRPDIAAAERRAAAANAAIGVAQAALYPNLSLTGSAGATSLAGFLSAPASVWSLGASLAQSLFDGGQKRAQVASARAAFDAAAAQYRQTVLGGFQEVEDNLAALRILAQEKEQQDAAVKSAREAERLATNQYKAGLVSYLNVSTAQATTLANERAAIQLLGRQFAASAALIKAAGGGYLTPAK